MNKITNEDALKDVVAAGLVPYIKEQVEECEQGQLGLYCMATLIGVAVNAYFQVFMTGNSVDTPYQHPNEEMKR